MVTTEAPPWAQTLRLQSPADWIICDLLCTPLISRGIGSRPITIYVVDRASWPGPLARHGSVWKR